MGTSQSHRTKNSKNNQTNLSIRIIWIGYTEKEIQRAMEAVSKNRTTLIIAHRLSTVVHADEILVLEDGLLVERGDHSALIKRDGAYAALWKHQREESAAARRLAKMDGTVPDPQFC